MTRRMILSLKLSNFECIAWYLIINFASIQSSCYHRYLRAINFIRYSQKRTNFGEFVNVWMASFSVIEVLKTEALARANIWYSSLSSKSFYGMLLLSLSILLITCVSYLPWFQRKADKMPISPHLIEIRMWAKERVSLYTFLIVRFICHSLRECIKRVDSMKFKYMAGEIGLISF